MPRGATRRGFLKTSSGVSLARGLEDEVVHLGAQTEALAEEKIEDGTDQWEKTRALCFNKDSGRPEHTETQLTREITCVGVVEDQP